MKEAGSFRGYELAKVDYEAEQVILRRDGREVALVVSAGESQPRKQDTGAADKASAQDENQPAMLARQGRAGMTSRVEVSAPPPFEPTADETRAGIDPNDVGTWPEGYRGPGIERALKDRARASEGAMPQLIPPDGSEPARIVEPGR